LKVVSITLNKFLAIPEKTAKNIRGAENSGVENAGADSGGIATDELSR